MGSEMCIRDSQPDLVNGETRQDDRPEHRELIRANNEQAPAPCRGPERRWLRVSMLKSLVEQLTDEPGAEDSDEGAEKRGGGDEDEDARVVVSCV